MESFRSVWRF